MKHWDGRDRDDVAGARLSRSDRAHLDRILGHSARPRRAPPHPGSMIGLALALGMLAGLAWLLAPAQAVSSKILH